MTLPWCQPSPSRFLGSKNAKTSGRHLASSANPFQSQREWRSRCKQSPGIITQVYSIYTRMCNWPARHSRVIPNDTLKWLLTLIRDITLLCHKSSLKKKDAHLAQRSTSRRRTSSSARAIGESLFEGLFSFLFCFFSLTNFVFKKKKNWKI